MEPDIPEHEPTLTERARRALIGAPRNVSEPSIFHKLSLIPILAWIGLGADGLSSSSYGPEEAFRTLGQHTYACHFPGPRHCPHRVNHILCLFENYRAFSPWRRRVHRGNPHDRRQGGSGIRMRPSGRLYADHHRVPRFMRGRDIQLSSPAISEIQAHICRYSHSAARCYQSQGRKGICQDACPHLHRFCYHPHPAHRVRHRGATRQR